MKYRGAYNPEHNQSNTDDVAGRKATPRIDIIGQNGNDGLHYKATCEFDEGTKIYTNMSERKDYEDQNKQEEDYLNKLIEDHWHYISGILQFTYSDSKEIGYHYRTAFRHGWKHAKEHFNA